MSSVDPLVAVTAVSLMITVIVALFAFYGSAVPSQQAVRRLEGLMSGTSVVEGSNPVALRGTGREGSIFSHLTSGGLTEKLQRELEHADLTISPGEFVAMRLVFAFVGLVVPLLLVNGVFGGVIGIVAAVIGYNLPKFYLNHRRKARVDKLNAQLPEALTMISNSLKAGFGLLQALNVASDQLSHPISTELARTIHEMNIGSSAEVALLGLSERSGSYDLDIVVTAILVQRTVGGNLGEILDTVAEVMRERIRIRGEIQTLTAQQKLTGIVIGLLPVGVGLMFEVMSPEYIHPLFATLVGKLMLGVAVTLETVGIMIIQRILKIEV
ncbi:MAG TPA: type II secretion system F family protein [Dehalococcoidia bacterium]|nr:type II secretion system F family protein [Dehalococcoidia bacterium]